MSLKSRLQRLGHVPGQPRPGDKGEKVTHPVRAGQEPDLTESALGTEVLPGLAQAARLLEQALGEARVGAPRPEPRTPFAAHETPAGTVARRVVRFDSLTSPVRAPLDLARTADPRVLSLLALDPALAKVDPRRSLFFDTETTGLGGAGTLAFLVGVGWFDGDAFVLEQLLLEGPEQEPALLFRLQELFGRAELLVSFNGKSFDLPLLLGRCVMNRVDGLRPLPHLDLLHVSRRIHKRRLQTFRLIELEVEVLGIQRPEDDIPGAEIPPRFGHFLRTGDFSQVEPVVLHNEWDVLSMVALLGVYGEPLTHLQHDDWLGVAHAYRRSRELGGALDVVERLMREQPSVDALDLRARLHKARGDRAKALADFERLARDVPDPGVMLELTKLYEHHQKDFAQALHALEQGTGETDDQLERRRARLQKKAAKAGTDTGQGRL
jgi:uncharacterized protein